MTRNDLVEAIVEQVYEDEKWLKMKSHIAGSASARGISGKRRNAYIYGAMRARGWKPKRERVNETMDTIGRVAKKTSKKLHRSFKREVGRSFKATARARRYKVESGRVIARGDVGRGLEMGKRADAVFKAHAPVVAAVPLGIAAGFFSAAPGGTEMGAIIAAKASKGLTRGLRRRRANRQA
jgi:hypothetical protein